MSTTVFIAVTAAAALHALWNALVKGGADKTLNMGAVIIGHIPLALVAVILMPLPARESLPFLVAGLALHFGYQWFLLRAYQFGDLTLVYPLARGSAPLIVTLVSVLFLGVVLAPAQLLAVAVIGAGIISLALLPGNGGLRDGSAAGLALVTGLFIASYSLVDGIGARLSGSSFAFFGWMAIGNGLMMAVYLALRAPESLRALPRKGGRVFLIGGSASFIAYALVTWAFTQAPIALVTALRETSIVFALLIGMVALKERPSGWKITAILVTLSGAVLLRMVQT